MVPLTAGSCSVSHGVDKSPGPTPCWLGVQRSRVVSILGEGNNAIRVPGGACHINVASARCASDDNTTMANQSELWEICTCCRAR
jgi:hypothetical protein